MTTLSLNASGAIEKSWKTPGELRWSRQDKARRGWDQSLKSHVLALRSDELGAEEGDDREQDLGGLDERDPASVGQYPVEKCDQVAAADGADEVPDAERQQDQRGDGLRRTLFR